ncbi:hypothetical protein Gasu2_05270 [Galdieria sulphuraria]|nr:hypothetical protein Gasu2_05270 [Galdieria sulphuraria]
MRRNSSCTYQTTVFVCFECIFEYLSCIVQHLYHLKYVYADRLQIKERFVTVIQHIRLRLSMEPSNVSPQRR